LKRVKASSDRYTQQRLDLNQEVKTLAKSINLSLLKTAAANPLNADIS
jgi:hypothetical protein